MHHFFYKTKFKLFQTINDDKQQILPCILTYYVSALKKSSFAFYDMRMFSESLFFKLVYLKWTAFSGVPY